MGGRVARIMPWLVGPLFLGLSIAYLASYRWDDSWRVLAAMDFQWGVMVASGTIIAFLHVRALRWRLLLAQFGISVPYGRLYLASSIGLTLGSLTPLQSGELTKVELLRGVAGVARLPAYSAMAVERMLDLGCVLSLVVVGWLAAGGWSDLVPQLWWICLTGLALLLCGVLALQRLPLHGRAAEMQQAFAAIWRRPGVGLSSAAMTLLGWLLVAAGWLSVLRSIGVDLDAATATMLTAVVTLVNMASLLPGAVGVSEASTAGFLRALDVSSAQALAGALMVRGYGLLVLASGVLHFTVWFVRERGRRRSRAVR